MWVRLFGRSMVVCLIDVGCIEVCLVVCVWGDFWFWSRIFCGVWLMVWSWWCSSAWIWSRRCISCSWLLLVTAFISASVPWFLVSSISVCWRFVVVCVRWRWFLIGVLYLMFIWVSSC